MQSKKQLVASCVLAFKPLLGIWTRLCSASSSSRFCPHLWRRVSLPVPLPVRGYWNTMAHHPMQSTYVQTILMEFPACAQTWRDFLCARGKLKGHTFQPLLMIGCTGNACANKLSVGKNHLLHAGGWPGSTIGLSTQIRVDQDELNMWIVNLIGNKEWPLRCQLLTWWTIKGSRWRCSYSLLLKFNFIFFGWVCPNPCFDDQALLPSPGSVPRFGLPNTGLIAKDFRALKGLKDVPGSWLVNLPP